MFHGANANANANMYAIHVDLCFTYYTVHGFPCSFFRDIIIIVYDIFDLINILSLLN